MQVKAPWTFIAMLAVGLVLALVFAAPGSSTIAVSRWYHCTSKSGRSG